MEENNVKSEEKDGLINAIVDWVFEELKESGQLFLDQLNESQMEVVKRSVENLAVFAVRAAVDKKNREFHLIAAQSAINTLEGQADLAILGAQNKVKSAFQGILFKISGGVFK